MTYVLKNNVPFVDLCMYSGFFTLQQIRVLPNEVTYSGTQCDLIYSGTQCEVTHIGIHCKVEHNCVT